VVDLIDSLFGSISAKTMLPLGSSSWASEESLHIFAERRVSSSAIGVSNTILLPESKETYTLTLFANGVSNFLPGRRTILSLKRGLWSWTQTTYRVVPMMKAVFQRVVEVSEFAAEMTVCSV
jgi:hypothetical protein